MTTVPRYQIEFNIGPKLSQKKQISLISTKLRKLGAAKEAKAEYDSKTGIAVLEYSILEHTLDDDERAVIYRNEFAFKRFRQFCIESDSLPKDSEDKETLDDTDWKDMSLGFFIAMGVSIEDAYRLSTIVRYDYGYWTWSF